MGTTFQPKSIRRGIGQKIEALESELDPNINPLAKKEVSGWAQQNERLKKEKARLKAITPDPINGDERKKLELRNQQLKEAMIKGSEAHNIPAMPSVGQMQDNPDYSTDQHRRWESTWKQWNIDSKTGCLAKAENGYGAVFEWKDGQYRLHADEEDLASNFGSIETFRPGHRVPLMDQHVPVAFSMPDISQSEYDRQHPDHKPLRGEIAAGIYFEKCTRCGKKVANKNVPFCAKHQREFQARRNNQEEPQEKSLPGKSSD